MDNTHTREGLRKKAGQQNIAAVNTIKNAAPAAPLCRANRLSILDGLSPAATFLTTICSRRQLRIVVIKVRTASDQLSSPKTGLLRYLDTSRKMNTPRNW